MAVEEYNKQHLRYIIDSCQKNIMKLKNKEKRTQKENRVLQSLERLKIHAERVMEGQDARKNKT